MTNHRILFAAAVCGVLVSVANADLRSDIQKVYDSVADATKKRDATALEKAFMAVAAEKFVYVVQGVKQDRKTFVGMMKQQMPMIKGVKKAQMKVASISQMMATAVVTTNLVYVMSLKLPDGKPHAIVSLQTTNDTWEKDGHGKWKLTEIKVVSDDTKLDGKPWKGSF